jgi:sigma-B regulation protein RsbU (phosphoserine phosphatase)
MDIAARVQQNLFPSQIAPMKKLDCAAGCVPAQHVGGDYYDFFDLPGGERAFVLADVSGKGVGAALLMANLQALFRSQVGLLTDSAGALLRSVNRLFHASTAPEHYATAFFALYDPCKATLRYVNCGHPAALLVRRSGTVEALPSTAAVLGVFSHWDCEERELALESGDTVMIFSDGVTEAESRQGEEFGEQRAATYLAASRHRSPKEITEGLMEAVRAFSNAAAGDDVTVIAARAC